MTTQLISWLKNLLNIDRWLKIKVVGRFAVLEYYATFQEQLITASVFIFSDRKIIKQAELPTKLRIKPGKYKIQVIYMSHIIERDIEIKAGQTVKKEFRFPGGILDCKAYEGSKEIKATIEIIDKETGEIIAKRTTPFIIHLEAGSYSLRAIYTSTE